MSGGWTKKDLRGPMENSKNRIFGIDSRSVFVPLKFAILIVSDSRTLTTDTSGAYLVDSLVSKGHRLAVREIVKDDISAVRSKVRGYIDDSDIDVVLTSGGTGLTGRDVTPEAITPLIEKIIDGFSVVFHQISFETIGLSTLQSRAFAGLAKKTLIFCLPGSTGAVRDGWEKIIEPQLDARYRPCNFVGLVRGN